LILEYEHAIARGAKIYCEIGGECQQMHHITAPHPEGLGAKNVMLNCLRDAGLQPTDVDGLNMHGTSTPLGDMAESKRFFMFLVTCIYHESQFKIDDWSLTWCCRSCRNYFFHSFDEIRNC
jgi:hypothetical protein